MITVDFSETIAASDLKGCRNRHLIEYMKIISIEGCVHTKIQTEFSQKLTPVPIFTKFCKKAFRYNEMKI